MYYIIYKNSTAAIAFQLFFIKLIPYLLYNLKQVTNEPCFLTSKL